MSGLKDASRLPLLCILRCPVRVWARLDLSPMWPYVLSLPSLLSGHFGNGNAAPGPTPHPLSLQRVWKPIFDFLVRLWCQFEYWNFRILAKKGPASPRICLAYQSPDLLSFKRILNVEITILFYSPIPIEIIPIFHRLFDFQGWGGRGMKKRPLKNFYCLEKMPRSTRNNPFIPVIQDVIKK